MRLDPPVPMPIHHDEVFVTERTPPPPPDDDPGATTNLPSDEGTSGGRRPPGAPAKIGPYSIRRVIASGGMGTIYQAMQENPRRPVAIKVMKHGIASPEALRRFEYEAQLLARLRHPGIAQIYEAGTHDEGSGSIPYFAMEYIANAKTLTAYAQEHGLSIRDRLDLFARVCDAIHHGHQRGIVHRDLKPGNILVDSSGQPRIIDFGVARATDSDLAVTTYQTEVGQLIGSLQYMSPEQFEADPTDIDTRSDVYALGIVLYELLTDRLPYDLAGKSIYEAARVVRETTPPRPGVVRSDLAGDAETIVMKAMEKDRDQRYQSAHGLAEDLRRFLRNEAIIARPPSLTYQFRIFARRNRAALAAGTTVVAVLFVASIVSTVLFFRAERSRAIAVEEADRAQAATTFLGQMLESAAPRDFRKEPTIADLLDQSAKNVGAALGKDRATEAAMRQTIARGYLNLGLYGEAGDQLEEAVAIRKSVSGEHAPETISALKDLSVVYVLLGRNDERERVNRAIVEAYTSTIGPDSIQTLNAVAELANALAIIGRTEEAARMAEKCLAGFKRVVGPNDPKTLRALIDLAWAERMNGDYGRAESTAREALQACTQKFGETDRTTRSARGELAATYITKGRLSEAAALYGNRTIRESYGVTKTFQGTLPRRANGVQIFLYWETWCPFSQQALPLFEDFYERFRGRGLELAAFTRVTESSTDEKVEKVIASRQLTYPVFKVDDATVKMLQATGTPYIVIVKDGKVLWENTGQGYSVTIPDPLLRGLLGETPA